MSLRYIRILLFVLFTSFGYTQNDCVDAIIVCGNAGSDGLSVNGIGSQELNGIVDCGSQENNSIWLKLNINTGGSLTFTLTPKSGAISEDFDFFIFGPNASCGSLGNSIRCSTTNPQAIGQANNHTGLNATETDVSEGPGDLGNSFLRQLNVSAGESYYLVIDRPIGNSDFDISWGGTATFNPPPTIDAPSAGALALKECDKDATLDQRTEFDLTQNDAIMMGTQTDVVVTYYTDSNDAIIGDSEIPNPTTFRNTSNPQSIYGRITNVNTLCFNFIEFPISVDEFIDFTDTVYEKCDDAADGNDTNGEVIFDMDEVTEELLAGNDFSVYTVEYYRTNIDALANTAALPRFFTNEQTPVQSIFIKVTNPDGCFVIREITVRVKSLPPAINSTLIQCDIEINPDGLTLFQLHEADRSLTTGDPDLAVAYFENTSDALAGINELTTYTNTGNPQNIVAIVSSALTGCSRMNTLTLSVNMTQAPAKTIYGCDVLGFEDGIAPFDLNDADIVLTPPEVLTFYRNETDALLEQDPITNPTSYSNVVPYADFVVARTESANNCVGLIIVNLIVNRLPNINQTSDGNDYVCIDQPDRYITIDAALIEDSPEDFTYLWYLDGNQYAASTYTIAVNQPGTYTVEVININACRKTRTIVVKPSNIAIIEDIGVVDFITVNNSVTINPDPGSIGTYEYSIDAPEGPFQSSNFFENVTSGFHTVYIRDVNGCGTVSQIVSVLGLPQFFTPNGDGIHDVWRIEGLDITMFSKTNVYIFDRFGRFVKEIAVNDTAGWDGTYQGSPLPADDYWYTVRLADGRSARGHFALKR